MDYKILETKFSNWVSVSNMKQRISEVHLEPSQRSKMELFVDIVRGWKKLTNFEESSVLDIWLCSEYASEFSYKQSLGWWRTNIPNTHEKSTKNQSVTDLYRWDKCEGINKNVE